jgi:hypothetical protein
MKRLARILLLVLVLLGSGMIPAVSESEPAGVVLSVAGEAYRRPDAASRPIRLEPEFDQGRVLLAGESVRCTGKGMIRLLVDEHPQVIRPKDGWFTLPRPGRERSAPAQSVLRNYFRRGGRPRDSDPPLFSPPPQGTVRPERFVFRWTPWTGEETFTLTILAPDGTPLWSRQEVPMSSGRLTSEAARRALLKFREARGSGSLTMRVTYADGEQQEYPFRLLSVEEEEALRKALAVWDAETRTSLLRLIGRASVFTEYRLFTEAAEGYRAARRLAPRSRDLLLAAITAARETGNVALERAWTEELERLPDSAPAPGPGQ